MSSYFILLFVQAVIQLLDDFHVLCPLFHLWIGGIIRNLVL